MFLGYDVSVRKCCSVKGYWYAWCFVFHCIGSCVLSLGLRVGTGEVDPNYWTTGERFLERVQTRFERLGR